MFFFLCLTAVVTAENLSMRKSHPMFALVFEVKGSKTEQYAMKPTGKGSDIKLVVRD